MEKIDIRTENTQNWTVGYIKNIIKEENHCDIIINCTEFDVCKFTISKFDTNYFCINDIIGIKLNRKSFSSDAIEGIYHIDDVIDIFSSGNWFMEYEYQRYLLFIGNKKYAITHMLDKNAFKKISTITKELMFVYFDNKAEDEVLLLLNKYIKAISISNLINDYHIRVESYTWKTNDGDSEERYRLVCADCNDNYLLSLLPNYKFGWSASCVNNFPKQLPFETYNDAVIRTEKEIKNHATNKYSKLQHFSELLRELLNCIEMFHTEYNSVMDKTKYYLDYHKEYEILNKRNMIPMFDTQKFVLVCRKSDLENNNIGDGYFLVLRDEWEDKENSIKNFDLLLTDTKNNTIKLFYAPNGAVVINQRLPCSRKEEYIAIK